MANELREILNDLGVAMTLFWHNCNKLTDVTKWPEDTKINTNSIFKNLDISDPKFDAMKEFERFKEFIHEFRKHTNKFYGDKIFNIAEYYIWSMRHNDTDDIILINIWEKAKLIKKKKGQGPGSKNHWEIKGKTCQPTPHGQYQ